MKRYLLLCLPLCMCACSAVTINPDNGRKVTSAPDYSDSKSFFLFGLIGEHHVDVTQICQGQQVRQMQSRMNPGDALKTFMTLGIYAPHTARVWCMPAEKEESAS